MTKEEYQKLAQSSELFKAMDPRTQAHVLNAEGAQMDEYIALLNIGGADLLKAKKRVSVRSR